MHFTKRELDIPRVLVQLGAALALGVFCAVTGPFGTYQDLGTGARYAYWIGLVLFGALSIMVTAHALEALRPRLPNWSRIAIVTLASAVPTTFAVAWAESLTRLSRPVPLAVVPELYGSVALVQLLILLFLTVQRPALQALLFNGKEQVSESEPTPAASPQPPAFLSRIPAHLGTELLALGAEDHYLRIVTARGSDLILMRLGDALKELHPDSGLQVHRSWWVSLDAVRSIRREGGRMGLVLSNGNEIPVSRTYLAEVRAIQWPSLERG
ncbi:MAG TPA: LytTR family DNA-binding domain-containing protein [Telluria sp.]|nr:LytTR family DNA-binding domain-containing protein [Telluria sp.]